MSTRHLNHIRLVDVIFSAKVEHLKMSKLAYLEDVYKKLSRRRLSVDVYQMSKCASKVELYFLTKME